MNATLEPRKFSLLIRLAGFILLAGFIPFGLVMMLKEDRYYEIFFMVAIFAFLIIALIDIYIKLFLKVSARPTTSCRPEIIS